MGVQDVGAIAPQFLNFVYSRSMLPSSWREHKGPLYGVLVVGFAPWLVPVFAVMWFEAPVSVVHSVSAIEVSMVSAASA